MATLYSIHLSKPIKGFGKPSVHSKPAMIAGHTCQETGEIVSPDVQAVREALPHYYRKAFDRTGGTFWFNKNEREAAYLTLHDARGRYLNTVYAIPYTFN